MGFLWAILMPVLIVGAGVLVRLAYSASSGRFLDFTDLASVSLNSLPWVLFISATKFAANSMVSNHNLVNKSESTAVTVP